MSLLFKRIYKKEFEEVYESERDKVMMMMKERKISKQGRKYVYLNSSAFW